MSVVRCRPNDRIQATLGHALPPPEQQARGDAVEPGDGGDRYAGLHRLLDQPDLFLGSVSPPALVAGDDFDALNGLRHRPSRLRRLSGRIGGRSIGQCSGPRSWLLSAVIFWPLERGFSGWLRPCASPRGLSPSDLQSALHCPSPSHEHAAEHSLGRRDADPVRCRSSVQL